MALDDITFAGESTNTVAQDYIVEIDVTSTGSLTDILTGDGDNVDADGELVLELPRHFVVVSNRRTVR